MLNTLMKKHLERAKHASSQNKSGCWCLDVKLTLNTDIDAILLSLLVLRLIKLYLFKGLAFKSKEGGQVGVRAGSEVRGRGARGPRGIIK